MALIIVEDLSAVPPTVTLPRVDAVEFRVRVRDTAAPADPASDDDLPEHLVTLTLEDRNDLNFVHPTTSNRVKAVKFGMRVPRTAKGFRFMVVIEGNGVDDDGNELVSFAVTLEAPGTAGSECSVVIE